MVVLFPERNNFVVEFLKDKIISKFFDTISSAHTVYYCQWRKGQAQNSFGCLSVLAQRVGKCPWFTWEDGEDSV